MDLIELPGPPPGSPGSGLNAISSTNLNERHAAILELASQGIASGDVFTERLRNEARDCLALAQVAPEGRLQVDWIHIGEQALRILMRLAVTAPRAPDAENQLTLTSVVVRK